ncbi:MAG: hypothetical protein AAF411_08775 [Myxococcota bacterium]
MRVCATGGWFAAALALSLANVAKAQPADVELELSLCENGPVREADLETHLRVEAASGEWSGLRLRITLPCGAGHVGVSIEGERSSETTIELSSLEATTYARALALSISELVFRAQSAAPVAPEMVAEAQSAERHDEPEVPSEGGEGLQTAADDRTAPADATQARVPSSNAWSIGAGFRLFSRSTTPFVGGGFHARVKRLRLYVEGWGLRRNSDLGTVGYWIAPVGATFDLGRWQRGRLSFSLSAGAEPGPGWARGHPVDESVRGDVRWFAVASAVVAGELQVRLSNIAIAIRIVLGGGGGMRAAVNSETRVSAQGVSIGASVHLQRW